MTSTHPSYDTFFLNLDMLTIIMAQAGMTQTGGVGYAIIKIHLKLWQAPTRLDEHPDPARQDRIFCGLS